MDSSHLEELLSRAEHGTRISQSDTTRYSFADGIYFYFRDDPAGGLANIDPGELKVYAWGDMRLYNGAIGTYVSLTWRVGGQYS